MKTSDFAALHVKGQPLVLYNVWDAGSAAAVAEAGAKAIATGSWSVAAAQGYPDGEGLPMADALRTAASIVEAVEQPVTVDFEGGYSDTPHGVAANVARLLDTGTVGLNLEDRIVKGTGLHSAAEQVAKIRAIRQMAEARGAELFINARTDVFFQGATSDKSVLLNRVVERAKAYADAGADGLFVPGLLDLDLIAALCRAQDLPVNIMRMGAAPAIEDLATAGVARISHGPAPYIAAMKALTGAAKAL